MAKIKLQSGQEVEEQTVNDTIMFLTGAYNMASAQETQKQKALNISAEDTAEVQNISLLFKTLAQMAASPSDAPELFNQLNQYQKEICEGSEIVDANSHMPEDIQHIILSSISIDEKNKKIYVNDPVAKTDTGSNLLFRIPIPSE